MRKKEAVKSRLNVNKNFKSKEFYTKLAVIGVIVAVIMGMFLFAGLRGVGKAIGDVPQVGYYYNSNAGTTDSIGEGFVYYETKVEQTSDDNTDCDKNAKGEWKCDENCAFPAAESATYCYDISAKTWDCYAPLSVIREGGADRLCVNPENYSVYKSESYYFGDPGGLYNGYNWLSCSGDAKGKVHLDQFYCSTEKKGKFYPCVKENDFDLAPNGGTDKNKFLCIASDKKWHDCSKTENQNIIKENKFYCNKEGDNWKWEECKADVTVSKDKTKICDEKKWVECISGGLQSNDKFYCNQKPDESKLTWQECNTIVKDSSDGKKVCNANKWVDKPLAGKPCTAEGIDSLDKSKYCNGITLEQCDGSKMFSLSENKKGYCDGYKEWKSCIPKNYKTVVPVDTLTANTGKFLCDSSTKTWVSCDSNLKDLKFDGQFYCGLKSEKWQWQKCDSSAKETYKLTSADQKMICSAGNIWKSCSIENKGPISSNKFYCDGTKWQFCTGFGFSGNLLKESDTKFWQCYGDAGWKPELCDKEGKKIINASSNSEIYYCEKKTGNIFSWKSFQMGTESITLSSTTNYEVRFDKYTTIQSVNTKYTDITLCDTNTELMPDEATICYKGSNTDKIINLPKKNMPILLAGNLYFIYYGQINGVKVASVIYKVKPIITTLDLSEENIYYGQNVLIELEGDNYLLSYTQSGSGNSITGNFMAVDNSKLNLDLSGMNLDKLIVVVPNSVVTNTLGGYSVPLASDTFQLDKLNLKLLKSNKAYAGTKLSTAPCKVFENLELSNALSFCLEGGALKLTPEALLSGYQTEPTKVKLDETYENYISATQSLNIMTPSNVDFSKVYLCDESNIKEQTQICYSTLSNKKTIYSLEELSATSGGKIFVDKGMAFIYEKEADQPGNKVVSAILVKDLSTEISFDSGEFSKNLPSGKRLVLKIGTEYYLLSHPNTGGLLDMEQLTLNWLPSLVKYPNKGKVEILSKGVTGIQFEHNKVIVTIYLKEGKYYINANLSKGIATSAAPPEDIEKGYEVGFYKGSPVKLLINSQERIFDFHPDDKIQDPAVLLVSITGQPEYIKLDESIPKEMILDGTNLTLLYHWNDLQSVSTLRKEGYIFKSVPLSNEVTELDYSSFVDNLVPENPETQKPKRLALSYNKNIYLLHHLFPASLELLNLNLTYYKDQTPIEISPAGNNKKITFSLPDGGRITLERDPYEETPPPFKIWAQTQQQVAEIPINLTESLYTTFSSAEKWITIVEPGFGTISVIPGIEGDADSLKLESTTKGKFTLNYKEPFVKDNTLFYYDDYYVLGDELFVKSVKIYQLYDLSKKSQNRTYNDQFIKTFTGGNELALLFNNTYYLLGYKGATSGKSFFSISNLNLRTIDGSSLYSPKIKGKTATFETESGNLEVTKDEVNNLLLFSTISAEKLKLESFDADEEFSHKLTTKNTVMVGGRSLSICSQKIYGNVLNVAGVCINDQLLREQPIEKYSLISFNSKPYLLEVNSGKGENKVVTIRKIIPIITSFQEDNWEEFYPHLIDGDQPIFNVSGDLYLPLAEDDTLENFGMQEYGVDDPETFYPENLMEIKSAVFNGTFVLKNKLLFAEQNLVAADQRNIIFKLENYKIVPYYGEMELSVSVGRGKTETFVTQLGGIKYTASYWDYGFGLILFELYKSEPDYQLLVKKFFLQGTTRTYTLDGTPIEFKFSTKEIKDQRNQKVNVPIVSISRAE